MIQKSILLQFHQSVTTLHQIGIRASSRQVCLSFKVLFKKKINFSKKKERNPFEVHEDLRTNLFSQEKENDAKSIHDF